MQEKLNSEDEPEDNQSKKLVRTQKFYKPMPPDEKTPEQLERDKKISEDFAKIPNPRNRK